jgi:diguanylate cyclase (GGDEF)-like protein
MSSNRHIAAWREKTFSSLLSVVLAVGTISTMAILPFLFRDGMWEVAAADGAALAWTFRIWRRDGMEYGVRVLQFLAVVYFLGITLLLTVGAASISYMLGPPLIAAILLGLRPAMLALALGAVSLLACGAADHLTLNVPGWEQAPFKASIVAALNYSTVGAMLALCCSTLLKGLSQSLAEAHASAAVLASKEAALRDMNARLERTSADVHRLAYYDVLTGLPNRRLLIERLDALIEQVRSDGQLGAVLYLDLDNFKDINDSRGHATGDALLAHVAARLTDTVRTADTVARIGGDEFIVLLAGLGRDPAAARDTACALARWILNELAAPLDLEGQGYDIRTSIGIALPGNLDGTAHDLLREADTAMYHAKSSGRNGIALYDGTMLAHIQEKLLLGRELGVALANDALSMHFQLQFDHGGKPVGAEMLMRWRRTDGSWERPDVFIPVAEASGLISVLGQWVLRQAGVAWRRLHAAGHALPLSINVSPLQFRLPGFVDEVRSILADTGMPPDQLIFEVTEGLLIDDMALAIARMNDLADLGIRFSIDDFGTGYSNLAYLSKMPLYELKIDKRFINDIPHEANGTAIVQSILSMASHLGLRVVAEGIETDRQATYLAAHGRPVIQGFLMHCPMPLEALLAWLDEHEYAAGQWRGASAQAGLLAGGVPRSAG